MGICPVNLAFLPFSPQELSVPLERKWAGAFSRFSEVVKSLKSRRMPPFIRVASKESHLPTGRAMMTQEGIG